MWEEPEARKRLEQFGTLLQGTIQRMQISRARGTQADRAQMIGFGVEVLGGLSENFEIDRDFRNRTRQLVERVTTSQGSTEELDRFFGQVLVALEQLDLLVKAL